MIDRTLVYSASFSQSSIKHFKSTLIESKQVRNLRQRKIIDSHAHANNKLMAAKTWKATTKTQLSIKSTVQKRLIVNFYRLFTVFYLNCPLLISIIIIHYWNCSEIIDMNICHCSNLQLYFCCCFYVNLSQITLLSTVTYTVSRIQVSMTEVK